MRDWLSTMWQAEALAYRIAAERGQPIYECHLARAKVWSNAGVMLAHSNDEESRLITAEKWRDHYAWKLDELLANRATAINAPQGAQHESEL